MTSPSDLTSLGAYCLGTYSLGTYTLPHPFRIWGTTHQGEAQSLWGDALGAYSLGQSGVEFGVVVGVCSNRC